jgi:hypothetical protein
MWHCGVWPIPIPTLHNTTAKDIDSNQCHDLKINPCSVTYFLGKTLSCGASPMFPFIIGIASASNHAKAKINAQPSQCTVRLYFT